MRFIKAFLLLGLTFLLFPGSIPAAPPAPPRSPQAEASFAEPRSLGAFEDKGARVEFSLASPREEAQVREGDMVRVQFQVTDSATGAPITPLQPASWVSLVKGVQSQGDDKALECKDWIGGLLQGTLAYRAEIDLNKFFILVMNDDRTISVIDPIMGVTGVTQLYAMVFLNGRGEDWVESPDKTRLYVTIPETGEVAVVNTGTFKVISNIQAGVNPVRIAVQPDGKYLWVGNDSAEEGKGGVTAIDLQNLEVAAFIPTGPGHHEIAFSGDSLTTLVTNTRTGTLSLVDTQKLEKLEDLAVGSTPVAVAFSTLSQKVYVASHDGTISLIDPEARQVTGTLRTDPGLIALRFAPGDRWGFIVNSETDQVLILDPSNNSLPYTLEVGSKPDKISFTQDQAYVRCLGTPDVSMINMTQLGRGEEPAVTKIVFGQSPPGTYADHSVADVISATGEWNTVVAVSPAEKFAYYYMEGMLAPMGSYTTYGRTPRAVRVVDRSLRETEKGVYETTFKVPSPGTYRVGFLLDAPVVYHCFEFTAAHDPDGFHPLKAGPIRVEKKSKEQAMRPKEPFTLRFALIERGTEKPVTGAKDVMVIATRPPYWQARVQAKPLKDGTYEAELTPDRPGHYTVFFLVPSRNMQISNMPFLGLTAKADQDPFPGGKKQTVKEAKGK